MSANRVQNEIRLHLETFESFQSPNETDTIIIPSLENCTSYLILRSSSFQFTLALR